MKVITKSTWRLGTLLIVCAVFSAFLATSVHGHGRGDTLMFPRRSYNYNRRAPSIDLMSDMFSLPVYFNSLFHQQQEELSHRAQSTRTCHVQELPSGEIELTMDVPGVAAADLNVELLEDGTVLRVSGSRHYHDSVTEFEQLFRLNKDVDANNLSVRLSDGVLRVTAPKKEKVIKKLPIVVEDEPGAGVVDVDAQDAESDSTEAKGERQEVDGMTITTEES